MCLNTFIVNLLWYEDRCMKPREKGNGPALDAFVKSPEMKFCVIPAKAGIQSFQNVTKNLDPVFQRGDDFLRVHHDWMAEKMIFKYDREADI